jgi:hypothetical protein
LNERFASITRTSPWTTALIVLSSAALGGIAVGIWNRKALATFRESEQEEGRLAMPETKSSEDDFY